MNSHFSDSDVLKVAMVSMVTTYFCVDLVTSSQHNACNQPSRVPDITNYVVFSMVNILVKGKYVALDGIHTIQTHKRSGGQHHY